MTDRSKDTPRASFERLESKRKSVHVVEQILAAIAADRCKVGDKLPSEKEIADQTGVSRPSVREALSVLRFIGVVETRVGDGTYVARAGRSPGGRDDVRSRALSMLGDRENPFEALEARRVVEASVVRQAAERRTEEDMKTLREVLEQLLSAIDARDYDGLLRADRVLHVAIAGAAHNSLIQDVVVRLHDAMEEGLWPRMKVELMRSSPRHMDETARSHRRLFEAVRSGDAQEAQKAMERHFDEIDELFTGQSEAGSAR